MINFTQALETLKAIRVSVEPTNNAPLKQSLLDLQGQLLGLQVQALEQQMEMTELSSEVSRLREFREIERKLVREYEAFMLVEDSSHRRGPYCVRCWNRSQVLQPLIDAGSGLGYCPTCKESSRTGPAVDTAEVASRRG